MCITEYHSLTSGNNNNNSNDVPLIDVVLSTAPWRQKNTLRQAGGGGLFFYIDLGEKMQGCPTSATICNAPNFFVARSTLEYIMALFCDQATMPAAAHACCVPHVHAIV